MVFLSDFTLFNWLFTRDDVVSQHHKFGCAFLLFFSWESKITLFFFFFFFFKLSLLPCPSRETCVIFIGCNFESLASQVAIAQAEKRYCVSKGGKSKPNCVDEDKDSRLCSNCTKRGLGRLKILSRSPSRATYLCCFLIYSQKARMSRIYFLQNHSSVGRYAF